MTTNLKVILSIVGVVGLLASPAMAKQMRAAKTMPAPSDARGSVAPYWSNEGGAYTPSILSPRYGTGRDFQNGTRG
jgi:hypothetical protein